MSRNTERFLATSHLCLPIYTCLQSAYDITERETGTTADGKDSEIFYIQAS